MNKQDVQNSYFEWLCETVKIDIEHSLISYRKLMQFLHETRFICLIDRDENRVSDGVALRRRYIQSARLSDRMEGYLDEPCSVLEVMVGLALRCEETIMDNPAYGNRTAQWFWTMIRSLGLTRMTDKNFDESEVDHVVYNLIHRKYSRDGDGGLFTVRNCEHDMRYIEIWVQMLWYLDRIS